MALLKWSAVRLHKRVDALEKEKATFEDLKRQEMVTTGRFERLEKSLDDHRRETSEGLQTINNNIINLLTRSKQ